VKFANANISSLVVTGDTNIDTNTFRVDSTANRVGIVQSNPQYPLDVTGDVNTTGVIRIGGTQVLSGTTLTVAGNVTSGNLATNSISATAITASGPLTLSSSNNTFDAMSTVTVTRTIAGTTVGSGVDIGTIGQATFALGTCVVELRITSYTSNNQVTKAYIIPFNPLMTWTGAKRALPTTSTAYLNDVGIDLLYNNSLLLLKLVRTTVDAPTVSASAQYQISMIIHYDKSSGFTLSNGWTPSSSTYTSTLPAVIDEGNLSQGSAITQYTNPLTFKPAFGIGTETPAELLDVNGSALIGGNLTIGQGVNNNSSLLATGTQHQIDCRQYLSSNVYITGTAAFSGTRVAQVQMIKGSCTLDVTINQGSNSNNSVTKAYTIPLQMSGVWNNGNWSRVLPSVSGAWGAGNSFLNDIDLDIQTVETGGGMNFNLAITRSKAVPETVDVSAPICVSIEARYNKFSGTGIILRYSSGSYTGFEANSTNMYPANLMTAGPNGVGFLVDPKSTIYEFDVALPANFRRGLWIDNVNTEGCFLSFGNQWRLYLNPTTKNLEIQYNNNPNDPSWSSHDVTGILASK
jgi:hypothetical protein